MRGNSNYVTQAAKFDVLSVGNIKCIMQLLNGLRWCRRSSEEVFSSLSFANQMTSVEWTNFQMDNCGKLIIGLQRRYWYTSLNC